MLFVARSLVMAAILMGLATACGMPDYNFGGGGGVDASAAGSGGMGGGTAEAGPDAGCHSDQDCSDPNNPRCNTKTGECVRCLASPDCPAGQYCASSTHTCQQGCKSTAECNAFDGGTGALVCDSNHRCSGCTKDDDCPLGKICNTTSTQCVSGCTAQHGCYQQDCCSGKCVDTSFDVDNCGSCGHVCQFDPTNSTPTCGGGKCGLSCAQLTADCNGNLADGCEADIRTDPKNCGTCKNVCPGNQICQNRACTSADAG